MKKLFFIAVFLLLLSGVVSAQSFLVTMVNQDPDPVRAGEVVEVRFKLENLWSQTKEDVFVEILPEYPFSLYSGSAVKKLGLIKGRTSEDETFIIDFKLKVDPNAIDGDHEINFKVIIGKAEWSYEDEFFIDIEKEEINLKAYIRSSDFVVSGKKGIITVELANAGSSDIEFLELELLPSLDYKLLSTSNYVYIGDLDSDDTESEDFEIYVDGGKNKVNIPIKVVYEVQDTDYEEKFDLSLDLLTTKEAKKLGYIKSSSLNTVLIIIFLALVGFWVYRRYKKKKR